MQINFNRSSFISPWCGGLVAAIALGYGALPANAIALNGVSASWHDPLGGDPDTVEFLSLDNEYQVRWGQPFNTDKSGLGFTGTGAADIELGESFFIGQLRHFNNVVFTETAATAVDLNLELAFSNPNLTSSFDFTLEIDETLNVEPCPYPGITICPDKISFPETIATNTIAIENENYTLELLGFSDTPNGTPVNELISEELGENNTFFYLFGRLVASDPVPQPVPEPGMLLGLSVFGIYLLKTHARQKD